MVDDALCSQRHAELDRRLDGHEHDISRLYDLVERVQNRPPVWCTVALSLLSTLLGMAIGVTLAVIKMA